MANKFINKKLNLTTTDNTTLFTVPDFTQSVIRSILVSEYAGSGSTITVTLTDASSNVFNLFTTKTIASNTTTELLTNPLILEEKEVLKVQAANANRFINKKVKLTTTDNTTIFTVPTATTSIVRSILVSEYAGSGSSITVTLTDSSSTVFNLFTSKAIASNATTELLTNPLILQENEILKVQAADANRLQVIVSILEVQPRTVLGGAAS